VASRKFKVTKRYGGITRNRNAERDERMCVFIIFCREKIYGRIFPSVPVALPFFGEASPRLFL